MKHELSDMLRDATSDPPAPRYSVDDFVAAGRRRQRRGRTLLAVSGTAAAVLAIAGAVAVPQLLRAGEAPPPVPVAAPSSPVPSAIPFSYPEDDFTGSIASYEAAGYTVSATALVTPGYQGSWITDPDETSPVKGRTAEIHEVPVSAGRLVVYREGAFDPEPARKAVEVEVGGGTGYYREGVPVPDEVRDKGRKIVPGKTSETTLTWEYADDAWAVVALAGEVGAAGLVEIAEGLTGSAPVPVRVGFKLGYIPAGFELASAGEADDELGAPLPGQSSVGLVYGRYPYTKLQEPTSSLADIPQLRLRVFPGWWPDLPADVGAKPYCVDGGDSLCYRSTADGRYVAELSGYTVVRSEELVKMLHGLTFADPAAEGTWFDATESVR